MIFQKVYAFSIVFYVFSWLQPLINFKENYATLFHETKHKFVRFIRNKVDSNQTTVDGIVLVQFVANKYSRRKKSRYL